MYLKRKMKSQEYNNGNNNNNKIFVSLSSYLNRVTLREIKKFKIQPKMEIAS